MLSFFFIGNIFLHHQTPGSSFIESGVEEDLSETETTPSKFGRSVVYKIGKTS